jgi:selenocysteine lyase/cysteine desulfurase
MKPRLYFDHAATRFPKPSIVLDAMRAFSMRDEAAAGRGAYRSSRHADEIVSRLRREIAAWIAADSDQEISIHAGGTEALNAALFGMLRRGDHVVTTSAEHNSVLRPLHHLVVENKITWTIVPVDAGGRVSAEEVLSAVTPRTRMVAVVHAGNVNGAVQPIEEIGNGLASAFESDRKPIFLSDAAQTFGHLALSVAEARVDVVAAPGHKGGWGPLGTGFLYVRRAFHDAIRPTLFGGTGTSSESLQMPTDYPSGFEAGNRNVPALAGWLAGLRFRTDGSSPQAALAESATRMRSMASELYGRLRSIDGIRLIGEPRSAVLPVASVAVEGMAASDAAMILDSEFGIEARSGIHCAALIHGAIASPPDGTLRFSCGESTTIDELDHLCDALTELCR